MFGLYGERACVLAFIYVLVCLACVRACVFIKNCVILYY